MNERETNGSHITDINVALDVKYESIHLKQSSLRYSYKPNLYAVI